MCGRLQKDSHHAYVPGHQERNHLHAPGCPMTPKGPLCAIRHKAVRTMLENALVTSSDGLQPTGLKIVNGLRANVQALE